MRTIATALLLIIVHQLFAQRECATYAYNEEQKASNSITASGIAETERFIQQRAIPSYGISSTTKTSGSNIIRIPVVVHILYNTTAQNISDAQVKSQIDALNRDFRKQNADTVNIPEHFKKLAADVEIEFVLATADPKGRATTGILRKQTHVKDWGMDDKIKESAQGGDDAWDSKSYLNIWVGNMRKVLGYASSPGSDAKFDGIVINLSAFGTINSSAPYNLGRTAVHEIGHWLGLKHIWGDVACGDDLVNDTPKQGGFTSGCPTGFRTSCSNSPSGDMYMNYMDFTNDACLNLFTYGQKQRMRTLFISGGPRNSFLSSKGLDKPWSDEVPVPEEEVFNQIKLYPSLATTEVMLRFDDGQNWIGKELRLVNMNGSLVQKIVVTSSIQKINISQLKPGMYFIQGENSGKKVVEKLIKL